MTEREKMINELTYQINSNEVMRQYYPVQLSVTDAKKILELLKEQEAVAPRKVKRYIEYSDTAVNFIDTYDCGNCGAELPDNAKYCPECGRKVKWDD